MVTLVEILTQIARLTNFSPDQVNFVFCMLSCFPLGAGFRVVLHPSRVSPSVRRIVGLLWGIALTWFCFGRQTLILINISALCYFLTCVLNPSIVHKYVLTVSMGMLSIAHIHRQITDYGGYTLDFTGPLMIFVQRISYVAFSVHDGMGRDESELKDEQRKGRLKKVPTLLEYFSYLFHYSTVLAGPVCTFKEFNDFIDGSDVRPKGTGQKEPSPLSAVLRKVLISLVCLAVILLTGSKFPISRNGDEEFINSHHLLWRFVYSYISILAIRMRYYFAFKMAEAVNNMGGLGFNGFDENGIAKWDRLTIVNVLRLEFATNLKEVLDNWNICTALWLRRIVYDRVPYHRTLAVFALSAFWHGFYPGYYMAFFTCGLMVEAARKVRRVCRPLFQRSPATSLFYDVVTCVVTSCCLTFTTIPFVALELRIGVAYWRSMYCFGHFWCLVPILFMNAAKNKKQQTDSEIRGEGEEKDAQKEQTKHDDLTKLRQRVNRKLEMLKENLMWGLRMAGMR